jgi:hypothetical protein
MFENVMGAVKGVKAGWDETKLRGALELVKSHLKKLKDNDDANICVEKLTKLEPTMLGKNVVGLPSSSGSKMNPYLVKNGRVGRTGAHAYMYLQ